MKALLPLLSGFLLLLPLARADHRDDDDRRGRGRGRVILFEHADYRGGALVLYPGDEIENFSGMAFDNGAKLNDGVSSIRVEGNVEFFGYENARFKGDALRVTENVRDLTGRFVAGAAGVSWNDRISSVRVSGARGRDGDRGPARPGPRVDPDKVVVAVFRDVLGREPDPGELRNFRQRLLDQGWTERMLRDHLRTEERYRVEQADRLIRRAYLELLGREVDESGLRSYRKKMLERNWTEGDVRDDLRKSAEYRNRRR